MPALLVQISRCDEALKVIWLSTNGTLIKAEKMKSERATDSRVRKFLRRWRPRLRQIRPRNFIALYAPMARRPRRMTAGSCRTLTDSHRTGNFELTTDCGE